MPQPKQKSTKAGGRPSKRDPALITKLLKALREPCSKRAACAHAGISEDTLNRWLEADPKLQDRYHLACAEGLRRAEGQLNKLAFGYTVKITKVKESGIVAGSGADGPEPATVVETTTTVKREFDLAALKMVLERRFKEEWGPNTREGSGEVDSTDPKLNKMADILVSIAVRVSGEGIPEPSTAKTGEVASGQAQ